MCGIKSHNICQDKLPVADTGTNTALPSLDLDVPVVVSSLLCNNAVLPSRVAASTDIAAPSDLAVLGVASFKLSGVFNVFRIGP